MVSDHPGRCPGTLARKNEDLSEFLSELVLEGIGINSALQLKGGGLFSESGIRAKMNSACNDSADAMHGTRVGLRPNRPVIEMKLLRKL